jgi:dipeptidyl aminopeptidase/acylaminoacyl peptidase
LIINKLIDSRKNNMLKPFTPHTADVKAPRYPAQPSRFNGIFHRFCLAVCLFVLALPFSVSLKSKTLDASAQATEVPASNSEINREAIQPPLPFFSRLPAYSRNTLSPSGSNVAFIQNFPSPHNLAVLTVYQPSAGKLKRVLRSDNKDIKINWFRWVNDDILLVSAKFADADRGVKYFQTRLLSIDTTLPDDEIKPERLLKGKTAFHYSSSNRISQFQDSVIDYLHNDPDHVLVEADFEVPQQPSVYRLNVRTGKQVRIERGKRSIRSWMTDQQSVVRVGRAQNFKTGEVTYYERKDDDGDFRVLFEYMAFEDSPISVRGFALDPNILYYTKYTNDKRALYKLDLTTMASELVLANDDYDVSGGLIYSGITQDAIGVYDVSSPYGRYYFDDSHYTFHKRLDKTFPDTTNTVISRSKDESIYMLYTESDEQPGMFFYGNKDKNSLDLMTEAYPELYGAQLAHHEKITYKTRDGIEIEAYLTLPKFGEAPFPTVIHPHGGPGARDFDGFDPWVSYMTSRGYAVMRPNFRGSVGYGFAFAQAQMGRWGLEMQDDITDATQFLIDQGKSDPDKICIFGASYGGYAAAMATVKTPDLFACAVSFAGVSDLRGLARNQRKFIGGALVAEKQLGDESRDLKNRSPLYNIGAIKTPILLMHGNEDRVVPVSQSRDFAEELEDAGKDVRYVELDEGDHHLSIQGNRALFFEELDSFLRAHLGTVTP